MKLSDNWQPVATLDTLKRRARIFARIRAFFAHRDVLEVETPALSGAATPDPALHSFSTRFTGPGAALGKTLYLHTSPEYPMKRLLAAGSGDIFQLCKVFRDGELGRWHNPEFTLLEWYRVGFDHLRLMEEVADLVLDALHDSRRPAATERVSYREAYVRHAGIDPHTAGIDAWRAAAQRSGIALAQEPNDIDGWRDLILTHAIEPHLGRGRLTFIYDYPASQAALARIRPGDPPLAERFELYLDGIELANGFHELGDAAEQRRRLERDAHRRREGGLPTSPLDERMLAALAHGLPDCAGVALGIDRLIMLSAGATVIQDVLAFPLDRA